jgi:hypothetical protein
MTSEKFATIEKCPVCSMETVVKLAVGWDDGRILPVIECGNPWHYIMPATWDDIKADKHNDAGGDPDLAEPECLCEGEFTWACGPECECWHHTAE